MPACDRDWPWLTCTTYFPAGRPFSSTLCVPPESCRVCAIRACPSASNTLTLTVPFLMMMKDTVRSWMVNAAGAAATGWMASDALLLGAGELLVGAGVELVGTLLLEAGFCSSVPAADDAGAFVGRRHAKGTEHC